MGIPGVIVDAAQAATQGAALRSWGGLVDDALTRADDALRAAGVTWRNRTPESIEAGLASLKPIPRELVHAKGWELRNAFVWRNDQHCVQRAAFGALSIEQAVAGTIDDAVAGLARRDASAAALAVQYGPRLSDRPNLHTAVVSRTTDGDYLVIDHLLADADDGVMQLDEWLRRAGTTREDATVLSPLELPPRSLHGGAGIPTFAKRHDRSFEELGGDLAARWDDASRHRLPQVERATVG